MKKLIEIQTQLKVPKGNVNKFGNYRYRSAEDILEAVKPILKKEGCLLFLTDEIVLIGSKYFLQATALFSDGTESVKVNGYAELSEHKGMSAEQATGTASSYSRKYALNGLFLIDETESDPDSKEGNKEPKKEEKQFITEAQFNQLYSRVQSGDKLALAKGMTTFKFTEKQIDLLNSLNS
jgi:hypothetical protein